MSAPDLDRLFEISEEFDQWIADNDIEMRMVAATFLLTYEVVIVGEDNMLLLKLRWPDVLSKFEEIL